MKYFSLLILLVSLCSCGPNLTTVEKTLNADYKISIGVPDNMTDATPAERAALDKRGNEVTDEITSRRDKNAGYETILQMKDGSDAFMVLTGGHNDELYGPYEEARTARMRLYNQQYSRETEIVENVDHDISDITIGEVTLQRNYFTVTFKPLLAGVAPDPMHAVMYEGLLSPTEMVMISFATREAELAEALDDAVQNAQVTKR